MTEYDAFGIKLEVGTVQTEYAKIVLDNPATGLDVAGNGSFTITHLGMAGSALSTDVLLAEFDMPADIAVKAALVLNAVGAISTHMVLYPVGDRLYCRLVKAEENEGTLKIGYTDNGCEGLLEDLTSAVGVAGVALAKTIQVTNITGPDLGLDTEDVTTHDQTKADEEHVATIIRSGEVTLDIVFDPADSTHDASDGLTYRFEDKIYSYFELTFPDTGPTKWIFFGYVTGFVPTGPVDGALTATIKIKVTAVPTLT